MFFLKKKKIPIKDFFPNGFTDIHSHLLPGIDDGAKNLDDSMQLISKMYSYGIKNFVTTPHIFGGVYENTSEIIKAKLKVVQQELLNRGMEDINIRAASEYMMDELFMERLEADDILTLKDNLVLVELPYFNQPFNLYDVLFQIQLKGYKPVLAHPERYRYYHNDFQSYYRLKKAGCIFQLDLLSLLGQYGKSAQKIAEKILMNNLYDVVGSDVHNMNHINLLQTISTIKNKEKLNHLLENNKKFSEVTSK